MLLDVEPKPTQQILPTPILQQTAFWAKVKSRQGWRTQAYNINIDSNYSLAALPYSAENGYHKITAGDILITLKSVGHNAQIAYVPYGPEALPHDDDRGCWLEELSERLRHYLPETCFLIRYDLNWKSIWATDSQYFTSKGEWLGPPDPKSQEIRMNIGSAHWNLRKAPTDILPSNTVFLDLTPDEDTLLQKMKPKTRYNIGLAQRKKVQVREATPEELPSWFRMYQQTAQRNRIVLDSISYFSNVLQTSASDTLSPAQVKLLIAEANGEPLSGMFLALSKERATYLYGASTSVNRNFMGPYALQWEAIKLAKAAGCAEYDMFGISGTPNPEHPMYGLYRFKTGFGGTIHHRQGCWDYPLNPNLYESYRATEMASQGFHVR
ncbi:MAG TPA: peptidoglycan bridge formation glycyltransferase FemA/FemB family protein [Tenuifilaceae bacterium]|nr:peptidoglycan bridge formation glycyltransferase FemA/FemB family protein [Tenuifilaceae bacterium]